MRKWNPNTPEVPVDADGNWMSYPGYGQAGWALVGQPWADEFIIDHMETGRSSKIVILRSLHTERTYPMFVADLVKGIQQGLFDVEDGHLIGIWTASKRGANYGIKAVKHEV